MMRYSTKMNGLMKNSQKRISRLTNIKIDCTITAKLNLLAL